MAIGSEPLPERQGMFRPFRGERQWRRSTALVTLLAFGLAGCGASTEGTKLQTGAGPRITYLGSVAADDPQAVAIARQTLERGGSAADAVAAAGLALTVTLPSRAGLGGGGICLIHRPDNSVAQLDFLPRAAAGSPYAIPGMVRGLSALQASWGTLRWQEIAVPAELLALNGSPASANLTDDLALAGKAPNGADGAPLKPGAMLPTSGLAPLYSALRLNGPLDFYQGTIAGRLAAGGLPAASLAAYKPVLTDTIAAQPARHDKIVFTSNAGGNAAAQAWAAVTAQDSADPAARMAAAVKAVGGVDAATGGTAVVASDASGLGIGCVFTMGQVWGSGAHIGNTGIPAASPVDGATDAGLVAAVEFNTNNGQLRGIFAGAGGSLAPAVVASTAYASIFADMPLGQALAAPRSASEAQGQTRLPDRVQAIACPGGLPKRPQSCAVASDPRGSGFAAAAVAGLQ